MSAEAKTTLVQSLEDAMQDDLTVSTMRKLKEVLNGLLADYNVEPRTTKSAGDSDDALEAFLNAKKVEGRSAKTLAHYKYVIEKLTAFASVPLGKIQVGHIRSFLSNEKDRGINDRTLEGYRSVYSSCFGWLHTEELIRRNPCANLGKIKCVKKIRVPFSSTDIELMREACRNLRDRAIIAFLLSTGARISEVCALDRSSIDFQAMECTVLGKGAKERTVYIDSVAGMLLQRYFADRKDSSPALFCGKGSERLTPGGVRVMLKQIEAASGVENIHPHRFRRTLATNLINHGMQLQEVSEILGHTNVNTTMGYVYIEKEKVKNNYKRYA